MSLNTQEVTQYHPWLRGKTIDDMGGSTKLTLLERLTVQDIIHHKVAVDGAGSTATNVPVFEANGRDFHLLEARIIPDGTLTAHASNYATLSLKVGATVKATVTTEITGSGDWVANTPVAMSVSDTDIDEDDVVLFVIEKAGSGVVVPALTKVQFTIAERAPF